MNPKQIADTIRERIHLKECYEHIFTLPEGEIVLKHLIRKGHVLSSTFVAGDSNMTAVQEGERRMVLSILRMVYSDNQELIKQIEEIHDA